MLTSTLVLAVCGLTVFSGLDVFKCQLKDLWEMRSGCNMADALRDNAGDILTLLESEREARRLR